MNVRKQIEDNLAEIMKEEIDFEVMCSFLRDASWHQVIIPKNNVKGADEWIKQHSHVYARGNCYMIKDPEIALMFKLKWS